MSNTPLPEGTLKLLVQTFKSIERSTFIITAERNPAQLKKLGKEKRYFSIAVKFSEDAAFHYVGLTYLPTISSFLRDPNNGSNLIKRKKKLRAEISNGTFNESMISTDEDILQLQIPRSKNKTPDTNVPYTIDCRITAFLSFDNYIRNNDVIMNSMIHEKWIDPQSKIRPKYVLNIPSPYNREERYYVFFDSSQTKKRESDTLEVKSFFPDSSSLSYGKSKGCKIVSLDVIERSTKKNLYIDSTYKAYLDNQSLNQSSSDHKQMQITANTIRISPSGVAVLQAPTVAAPTPPPIFDDLKEKITKLFGMVGKLLKAPTVQPPKQTPTKKHSSAKAASHKRSSAARNSSTVHKRSTQKNSARQTKAQSAASKRTDQAKAERPVTTGRQNEGEPKQTYYVSAKQRATIVKRLKEEQQTAACTKARKKDHNMSHDD